VKCDLCGEDFGELINSFPHMAEKHLEMVLERFAAVDKAIKDKGLGFKPKKIPVDPIY